MSLGRVRRGLKNMMEKVNRFVWGEWAFLGAGSDLPRWFICHVGCSLKGKTRLSVFTITPYNPFNVYNPVINPL